MKQRSERYTFFESIVLSMAALGIYNCVIQFLVYPIINRTLGNDAFGSILTLISVQAILAVSVGAGVSYARMANVPRFRTENGDYNRVLLAGFALIAVVTVLALHFLPGGTGPSYVLYPILSIALTLRYYSNVAFRLEINYRKNFVFYILMTVGYLLGLLLFKATKLWETAILLGEVAAVLYVVCTSPVLRKPFFKVSSHKGEVAKNSTALMFSQLFSNLTLHSDRILIGALSTGTQVTIFYTASLLGKAMAMLTEPIAGVAIGYLARSKSFGRKQFLLCAAGCVVVGALIFLVFIPVTPFVIGILYPDIVKEASPYFMIANGGQILYFIANLLLVILLRFTKEKYQFYVNIFYCAAFFALCIPALTRGSLMQFCTTLLLLNAARLLAVVGIGTLKKHG